MAGFHIAIFIVRNHFFPLSLSGLKSIFTCNQSTPRAFVLRMQNCKSINLYFLRSFLKIKMFAYLLLKQRHFKTRPMTMPSKRVRSSNIRYDSMLGFGWQLQCFGIYKHTVSVCALCIKQIFCELSISSFIAFIYLNGNNH